MVRSLTRPAAFSDDKEKEERQSKARRSRRVVLAWTFVATTIWAMFSLLWSNERLGLLSRSVLAAATAASSDATTSSYKEYVMWSPEETYFKECARSFIGNSTWGEPLAPLVDKITVKDIVKDWSSKIEIVPTLTYFDQQNASNFTLEMFQKLPQPYIIKASHVSGSVAIVQNNTYHCFKACHNSSKLLLSDPEKAAQAHHVAMEQVSQDLQHDFSTKAQEMQYHFIPKRIIVEQALPMHEFKHIAYWYVAAGQPIFAELHCRDLLPNSQEPTTWDPDKRAFFSADFGRLVVKKSGKENCYGPLTKPKMWDKMHQAATELGQHVQDGVVRIDLYASDTQVYFSELTFTTGACYPHLEFTPRVADGLLYAILKGHVPAHVADADFVERTIGGTSWVNVPLNGTHVDPSATVRTHPSPVDLCNGFEEAAQPKCYEAARAVENEDIRCIISSEGKIVGSTAASKRTGFSSASQACELAVRSQQVKHLG